MLGTAVAITWLFCLIVVPTLDEKSEAEGWRVVSVQWGARVQSQAWVKADMRPSWALSGLTPCTPVLSESALLP